jgi:hypothetical protein
MHRHFPFRSFLPPLLLAWLLLPIGCGPTSDAAAVQQQCSPGFVTSVVSVTYGKNAGFGQDKMPAVVMGPPHGDPSGQNGSIDVVSLGQGGEIVLGFAGQGLDDGAGADFIVFENAFNAGGDPTKPYAEPGQVSVSEDGVNWSEFPCKADSYPYDGCAGWHVVKSNPDNGVSPYDSDAAGGEAYDLALLGVKSARYVRIQDRSEAGSGTSAGFDLDAISVIHAACE